MSGAVTLQEQKLIRAVLSAEGYHARRKPSFSGGVRDVMLAYARSPIVRALVRASVRNHIANPQNVT